MVLRWTVNPGVVMAEGRLGCTWCPMSTPWGAPAA